MEPIPISALEHYVYCPRQCALIHMDGVWADNTHTLRGVRGHRRADTASPRTERGRLVLRGVPLWSEAWGLTGRADAVEIQASGEIVPVEYKIGRRHANAAEVQLCAQALCLEEMLGSRISHGAVWYSGPRQRERIPLDDILRTHTEEAIRSVRAILESSRLPVAPNDARCGECQLLGYCLPDVVAHSARVSRFVGREVFGCA